MLSLSLGFRVRAYRRDYDYGLGLRVRACRACGLWSSGLLGLLGCSGVGFKFVCFRPSWLPNSF